MFRKFWKSLVVATSVAALASSIMVPSVAASSGSIDAGVKTRMSFSCFAQVAYYDKLDSLAAVRVVKDEYDDTAPIAASPALTEWVDKYHPGPCAATADAYVRGRVSAAMYAWYLDVVAIYGT
jgi:hypothetical protein